MGLTDLMSEIKQDSSNFYGDEAMEHKVLQHVLKLVEDKISEVKNQAVKWCVCSVNSPIICINYSFYEVWVLSSRLSASPRWSSSYRNLLISLEVKTKSYVTLLDLV